MSRLPLAVFFALFGCSHVKAQWWSVQTSGADSNLRGVSTANASDAKGVPSPVVWVSGSNGVILRSLDEGKTWKRLHVQGGDKLDFRGLVAFSDKTAYLMSSGEGDKSRIYKTADGGQTWEMQYADSRKPFFLDAISCASETACFALADPMDGKFLILETRDGRRWASLPPENLPAALPSEGAFAASNSCLAAGDGSIAFVTGGPAARFFRSSDLGRTWSITATPVASGNVSSGIFSFAGGDHTVVVGGDYTKPNSPFNVSAYSLDSGQTWHLSPQQPGGYRSAVARVDVGLFIAVGPNGSDVSWDSGVHWKHAGDTPLNAVSVLDVFDGWAVGPNGTVAKLVNPRQYEIRNFSDSDFSGPHFLSVASALPSRELSVLSLFSTSAIAAPAGIPGWPRVR